MRRYRKPYKERVKLQLFTKFVMDLLFVVMLAYFIVLMFGMRFTIVGNSMNDTLVNEQVVLINKASYHFHEPMRYDLILFKASGVYEGKEYVKRIIGLPGETIQIQDGKITVNGMDLVNDISDRYILTPGLASEVITLAENEYFVLGDNRNNSEDSRFYTIGNVKRENILGKVWIRIHPLDHFGIVK
ncbi:MAG: signal peptidase I [Lachnospiraceae bacterium]|nr:signal peptidase I [Lachnospiraceae bacterium]